MRFQEDKRTLPLDLTWLTTLLRDAATLLPADTITAEALRKIKDNRSWRHGYLADRGLDEILQGQVYIQTQGSAVGQINGLSVLQYPDTRKRPESPPVSPVWHISVMVNLLMWSANQSLAVIFTPRA